MAPGMEVKEKRESERYEAAYPVEDVHASCGQPVDIVNISKGGAAFHTSAPLNADEKFDLKVYLKNKMFQIRSIVIHSTREKDGKNMVGVKFQNPPENFREELEREAREIKEFQKECDVSYHKKLSFKEASLNYLKNIFPWDL